MKTSKAGHIFLVGMLITSFFSLAQRRGGPPRRIANPKNLQLPGGSKVEFRSFFASSIREKASYSVYFPPAYQKELDRKFPVIYFLHGMFNDHTSWTVARYGNFPLLIEKLMLQESSPQCLMVYPEGRNSMYTDFADGSKKYEQYIYQDLVREIESHFRVKKARTKRAIGGTSMGGYGALKIAMKHPELYGSVAAASPIILLGKNPTELVNSSNRRSFFSRVFTPVFGLPFDQTHWEENSIEVLARSGNLGDLKIYLAYGTADRFADAFPMRQGIETVDGILSKRGFSHVLKIFEGEPHGWELIRNHIEEILQFLTQTF